MTSDVRSVGVIGAGTMGAGIAQVIAAHGIEVVLVDRDDPALDRGLATITTALDWSVAKGRIADDERDATLTRIEGTTDLERLDRCDIVIEAVFESLTVKADVLRALGDIVGSATLVFSNTSSISVTALAARFAYPERFAGLHFFNPVAVLPLVEVIRGEETGETTIQAATALAERLGKQPIVVTDAPGFVANRLLLPMINEAIFCLSDGIASADDIDAAMTLGASHPMGPLALADLIGLDVCLDILEVLHRDFGDDKYRPAPLLRRKVAAGHLGRKRGRGFRVYGETRQ